MSYDYTNGDGLAALIVTEPADSDEIAVSCAQSIRQIKLYLNDPTASVASYTKTATDAAIAAAIAAIPPGPGAFNSKPARAGVGGGQLIPTTNVDTKITLGAAVDPAGRINGSSEYVVADTGYYRVSGSAVFGNSGGAQATMECAVGIAVNGVNIVGDLDSTPSPNGQRWSPGVCDIIACTAGDLISLTGRAGDTVGAGNVSVDSGNLSVERLST